MRTTKLKQNKTFSPKQVSRALGVSEASIKRWCDQGIVPFNRTAGGHRRLSLHMVLEFVRENKFVLAQPELLGLPTFVGSGSRTLDQAFRLYRQALEQGDEARCLQLAFDMRLAGYDMAVIGDRVVAPAFHELGQRWEHGETAVYQERRGVEMTLYTLFRVKDTLAPPDPAAPTAIGATLSGDPYTLPGLLCELVLVEMGWQARFLGSDLPMETVARAVEDLRPRVLFLSMSSLDETGHFIEGYRQLYEVCLRSQCAVVVGGRALTSSLRQELPYASYGDNLQHLCGFAHSLYRKSPQ